MLKYYPERWTVWTYALVWKKLEKLQTGVKQYKAGQGDSPLCQQHAYPASTSAHTGSPNPCFQKNMPGLVTRTCDASPGEAETSKSLGLAASQIVPLGVFQASKRELVSKEGWMAPEESFENAL